MSAAQPVAPVSVVMPLYNAAAYIGAAIESILAQPIVVAEILVVDDGSTDDGASIAGAYPGVRVIRAAHRGVSATRNRGIAEARGEFLAFLDADDLWVGDKLAQQLGVLAAPGAPDLVFAHAQNFHSPELSEAMRRRIQCPPEPLAGYVFGTLVTRRRSFARVGPLDETLTVGELMEWLARAQDLGLTTTVLPDVFLRRRLHADNLSQRERAARPDFARVLKSMLDRRRQRIGEPDNRAMPS